MAQFAGYGFNKSHAAAYALISYRTAFLKANYPEEFMAALLTSEIHNSDKIVAYINECREMGIEILPPDVNESESDFNVVDGRIRFGMSAIKNVGLGAIEAIIAARNETGPFNSLFNFCETVDLGQVNVRVVESLIKCGAFDSIDSDRAVLLAEMEEAIAGGSSVQNDRKKGQGSLFDSFAEEESSAPANKPRPKVEPISNTERLQFEKSLLGFYVTGHPLAKYESTIKQFASTNSVDLPKHQNGQTLAFAGIITSIRKLMTKRGEQMARLEVEDLHGSTSITVFPKVFEKHRNNLTVDAPMFFIGRVDFTNDQVNFLLSELFRIDTVLENMASSLHIRINSVANSEDDLAGIADCVKDYKGSYPLYFHFFSAEDIEQRVLKAGPDWGISPCTELEKKLESLLGKDKIWYNIRSDLFSPNNSRRN
jgi:DNA polymerase-3 subunit alpha